MNEIRNLTIEEAFASAIQNHKKNKFVVAKNLYEEIFPIYSVIGWLRK